MSKLPDEPMPADVTNDNNTDDTITITDVSNDDTSKISVEITQEDDRGRQTEKVSPKMKVRTSEKPPDRKTTKDTLAITDENIRKMGSKPDDITDENAKKLGTKTHAFVKMCNKLDEKTISKASKQKSPLRQLKDKQIQLKESCEKSPAKVCVVEPSTPANSDLQ